MQKFWQLLTYFLPFVAGCVVLLMRWFVQTEKPFDFPTFSALLLYAFPVYVFIFVPVYGLLQYAYENWLRNKVMLFSCTIILAVLQTLLCSKVLRVEPSVYLDVFIPLVVAALMFSVCLLRGKE